MKKNNTFNFIVMIIAGIYLLAPIGATIIYSFFRDFTSVIPQGFTLDFYKELFAGAGSIWPTLLRTILIGVIPTAITTLIVLLALYGTLVYHPKFDAIMNFITKIPYGIQGVILAVAIIAIYANTNTFFSNRVFLLGCSYCVVISPYIYQGIRNVLLSIDMIPILEAAELLGASKLYTYFKIIVPSIGKGILATMLLCIGILFGDFVLVNILAGSYYETLGIYLNNVRARSGQVAAGVSTLMFIMMIGFSMLVNYLNREHKEKIDEE
ncbi:MAG: ABC transporter permease subunit [Gallicola sp.]|nr:ABC transporter permease subunit [Gallicola sp.]